MFGKTEWHLHRRLLATRSNFYVDGSYNGNGDANYEYQLPEPFTKVMPLFVQWLYTSTFTALSPQDLFCAYFVGAEFKAPTFQNKVLEKLFLLNRWKCTFILEEAQAVVHPTNRDCPLRRFLVDAIALAYLRGELNISADDWIVRLDSPYAWSEIMAAIPQQYASPWKEKDISGYLEDETLSPSRE